MSKGTFFRLTMVQSHRVFFQFLQRGFSHILHKVKRLQRLNQVLSINHEISVLERKGQVSDIVVDFGLLVLLEMVVSLKHLWVLFHLGYELVHCLLLVMG
jgi:hypothetical protein